MKETVSVTAVPRMFNGNRAHGVVPVALRALPLQLRLGPRVRRGTALEEWPQVAQFLLPVVGLRVFPTVG